MGLARTVEPATEPLTLAEAKLHLREDLDEQNTLITALIQAAREAAENFMNRALVTQTWQLTIDGDWPEVLELGECIDRIVLPRPPVASVSSVQYVDLSGNTQTLAADQYVLSKRDTGQWSIDPAYGVIWPDVRDKPATITVTFVCGTASGSVPAAIRAGMLLLIGHLYENREAVNVGNIVTALPLAVDYLWSPYRCHPHR